MTVLQIAGQNVDVGNGFIQLSPADQHAAVEAIAKKLQLSGEPKQASEGYAQKAIEPLTSLPSTYEHMVGQAEHQMGHGYDQLRSGNVLRGAGNIAEGALDYVSAPINAPLHTIVGKPVQENFGVPAPYTEFAASMLLPVPKDVSAVVDSAAPVLDKAAGIRIRPITAASKRLADVTGDKVNVPRAIASDNIATQRLAQGLRNIPIVGDRIPQATQDLVDNLDAAKHGLADQYGGGSGPNVASRIGQILHGASESETQAATDAAHRSDDALLAAHQRDIDAAHADIASREHQSLETARQAVGTMSPQDMGAELTQRLRTGEAASRANKEALYQQAGQAGAAVNVGHVQNVRSVVAQGLEDAGVIVDPNLTPAASRMMGELQRLAELRIPNEAVGRRLPAAGNETPAAVNVQGLEQIRKRLSFFRGAASNDADRRAATAVMRQFDKWESDAFDNALFSGSDDALKAYRQARAANASWRDRFFNDAEDADKVVNRIVTGEITPQEVANYIIGAGQVGAKGVSSRLLTRIADATNNDPQAMQAIRGGIWHRLSQATEGAEPKAPAKVAKDIVEFLNGSGRDVAQRLFTPDQRRLMRAYADTLRSGQDARALIGEVAKTTKPGGTQVIPGPMKQLADAVLGKGSKSDEALFRSIDSYAKSGNRADVATLAKLLKAIPEEDRKNLAGAIIRNLGISPRTGQFSPDVFVSQWRSYTPQAKALLFGNAGPQRQAIDDIMMISDRLKQIGSRFGNPSGTAQNANFAALGAGLVASPLTTIMTAIGGFGIAKLLAEPAGAASAAKWSRAYQALRSMPTPQKLVLFELASRNLANTASGLGIQARADDFLRALQGPDTSSAQQEQQ